VIVENKQIQIIISQENDIIVYESSYTQNPTPTTNVVMHNHGIGHLLLFLCMMIILVVIVFFVFIPKND
jgi:hypothetical protein